MKGRTRLLPRLPLRALVSTLGRSLGWGGLLFFLALAPLSLPAQETGPAGADTRPSGPPLLPDPGFIEDLPKPTKRWSARLRSDFYSQYLWNGVLYSEGPVWQPSATLEIYDVGMTVWGNFVLGDEPNQGEFNEVDLTLYYQRDLGKWSLQASLIAALYLNDDPASRNRGPNSLQGYFQVSRALGPVKLFTDLNVGFLEPAGTILWDFGVSYRRNLPLKFRMETSLLFAVGDARFNKAYFADVGMQANLLVYSLAFPWAPLQGFSFVPSLYFSNLLAPSLRRASPEPTVLWGGLSVVYDI